MNFLDWLVLFGILGTISGYGIYKNRRCKNVDTYLLANRNTNWRSITLSVMVTQISAITLISVPGLAYYEGMSFIQLYLGLPIAMVLIARVALPVFQRLKLYSIYEYLEIRFDRNTRYLGMGLFLLQRGLAAGFTIFAPSLALSAILGWDIYTTSILTGVIVTLYTTIGGANAVRQTHTGQMLLICIAFLLAFAMVLYRLPDNLPFQDAIYIAGKMGKLNALDLSFDWENKYSLWSGLIGGLFLALAYFGTDQTQTQRYLSGSSLYQSRLSLLANGFLKIPMQAFILLTGVLIFTFYQFTLPPLWFNPAAVKTIQQSETATAYEALKQQHQQVFREKQLAIDDLLAAKSSGNATAINQHHKKLIAAEAAAREIHQKAATLMQTAGGGQSDDSNFVFLSFSIGFLPAGMLGLVIAAILSAAMASAAAVLNSLATTTGIDLYRRMLRPDSTDRNCLCALRIATIFWGSLSICFSIFASRAGSLIEVVNLFGSIFYGPLLGIFAAAFLFKHMESKPVFWGAIIAQIIVFCCYAYSDIAYLWFNVIGCCGTLGSAFILQSIGHFAGFTESQSASVSQNF